MDLLAPGTLIADRYLVVRSLVGGMGIVYLCTDRAERDYPVALKTFRPEFLPDREARDRFLREGATWVNLGHHQNIVRAYRVERVGDGRQVYLVLEWITPPAGFAEPSLRSWMPAGRPLPLNQALLFALHIARGMRYVTSRMPDLVHRDLKPENVLIDHEGNGRVTDFGLAVTLVGLDVDRVRRAGYRPNEKGLAFLMTNKGVLGTPLYMAPEQWTAGERLDARTDIYALGCVLYEMLTGRPAFWGKDIDELEQSHRRGRVGRLPAALPPAVRDLVWRCLDPDRERRWQTWEAVEQAVAGAFQVAVGKEAPPGMAAQEETRYERVAAGWSYNTIGLSYYDIGKYDLALGYFEQAVRVGRAEKDGPLECAGLRNLGNTYRAKGSFRRAIEFHEDALTLARQMGDRQGELQFLNNLGDIHSTLADTERAQHFYEHSLALAKSLGDRAGEATALNNLGTVYGEVGNPRRAIRLHEQALAMAREMGDRRIEEQALCRLAERYLAQGNGRQASELGEQALQIAWEMGDLPGQAQAMSVLARASLARGDLAQAIDLFRRVLDMAQEVGDRASRVLNMAGLGQAYRAHGEHGKAVAALEEALDLAHQIGLQRRELDALAALGAIYLETGKERKAVKVAERQREVARELGDTAQEALALRTLGIAHHKLGDFHEAAEYLARCLDIARAAKDRRAEVQLLRHLGHVLADVGEVGRAIECFDQAQRIARKARHIDGAATACLDMAGQWMRMGRWRDAQRCAEAAEQFFRTAGRTADVQQARELIERIRSHK